jgi:hypothetical protein
MGFVEPLQVRIVYVDRPIPTLYELRQFVDGTDRP